MARQVQIIKGTTAQNEAFTGAEGVLTYDSDKKDIRIHDGTTAGGFEIPSAAMADYVIYWDHADATDHSHAKPGVSTPTDHGWYRVYKSGWCEQGGIYNNSNLTYVVPMADTNYVIFLQAKGTSGRYAMNCQNITTTGASIQTEAQQWHNYSWQVSGYAA